MARERSRAGSGAEVRELGVGETRLAHVAMRELRPSFVEEAAFVARVDDELRGGGYRLLGSFDDAREQAVAAAGFRLSESLALGRFIYVDDLSTLPQARRQGHAAALMGWIVDEGRRLGCARVHLDSVVGPTRFDAHRFYHAFGMAIAAHHFAIEL